MMLLNPTECVHCAVAVEALIAKVAESDVGLADAVEPGGARVDKDSLLYRLRCIAVVQEAETDILKSQLRLLAVARVTLESNV